MYIGELISLGVAFSFTITALFAEVASKRIGSLPLNLTRMLMSITMLALLLFLTLGVPYPRFADGKTWFWLALSGFVGYVLGDYCLFQGYILIGSRFGQLLMTLSAPTAAIVGRLALGEKMSSLAILGMLVTLFGIGLSVMGKEDGNQDSLETDHPTGKRIFALRFKLPLKGILYGCCAGIGQGIGLVLSKIGMHHYEASILSQGIIDMSSYYVPGASIHLPLSTVMPFASTMIRASMGIVGFSVALFLLTPQGGVQFRKAICDGKAMLCAFGSMLFGPFVGVSLSLMATLYTSTGIAQTIMALTPVLILAPACFLFRQKVTPKEIIGAVISVGGVCLFFI